MNRKKLFIILAIAGIALYASIRVFKLRNKIQRPAKLLSDTPDSKQQKSKTAISPKDESSSQAVSINTQKKSPVAPSNQPNVSHQLTDPSDNVKEIAQLPDHEAQPEENKAVKPLSAPHTEPNPPAQTETLKKKLTGKTESKPTPVPVEFKQDQVPATSSSNQRVISLVNEITRDDLTYKKHWSGQYTPSSFYIKINDQELMKLPQKRAKGDSKRKTCFPSTQITVTNNEVDVEVYFNFTVMGKSHREERKQFKIKIPEATNKVAAHFTWETDSKVFFTPLKEKTTTPQCIQ